MNDAIAELVDRGAITDVLLAYAHAVDRQDFALARGCYHPDAVDDHGRYHGDLDGLIEFFETLGPTLRATTHQMGPPWIRLDGDVALVETYCLYRRESHGAPPEQAVVQGLRYLDRFERRDGRWAIAHRQVVLDWEQSGAAPPTIPSGPTWSRGGYGGTDPSALFFGSAGAPAPG
jgi:ketosteroid isomerase-like protein